MLVAVEAQSMEVTLADQALFGLTQMEFTALVARTNSCADGAVRNVLDRTNVSTEGVVNVI